MLLIRVFLVAGLIAFCAPRPAVVDLPPAAIALNQIGFYPQAQKIAIVTVNPDAGVARTPASDVFYILSARQDTVFTGSLGSLTPSSNSSLQTRLADFSAFRKTGTYTMAVPGMPRSYPFRIDRHIFSTLTAATLKGYYYQRSAMALTPEYAGAWSRPAGHPDTQVLIHSSAASQSRPEGTIIPTPGGWYDAGDYNKYIVNSGITMGTLLSAYEDFPAFFDTLHTQIPPISRSPIPDLLNETLYNLRWMLTMQDPNDGGVYHKCTNAAFDGMVMPGVTTAPRYVVQKGTAATLDFAAVMAQAARLLKKNGRWLPHLADSCRQAAVNAWQWAVQHPALAYNQDSINRVFQPRVTTGAYGDRSFRDEWFWAASELLITTGDEQFATVVREHLDDRLTLPSWGNVYMLGVYSLLRNPSAVATSGQPAIQTLRQHLLQLADTYVDKLPSSAWHTVMGGSRTDFIWGSNSVAANQGVLLVNAWKMTKEKKYLAAALDNLDYLLGRNATGYCFVTGMGSRSPEHPHHRPSIADGIPAPVPGLLVGGPNPGRQDRQVYTYTEPETAYTDLAPAYACNEIAINWNAPLVYLAGALEALQDSSGFSSQRLK